MRFQEMHQVVDFGLCEESLHTLSGSFTIRPDFGEDALAFRFQCHAPRPPILGVPHSSDETTIFQEREHGAYRIGVRVSAAAELRLREDGAVAQYGEDRKLVARDAVACEFPIGLTVHCQVGAAQGHGDFVPGVHSRPFSKMYPTRSKLVISIAAAIRKATRNRTPIKF